MPNRVYQVFPLVGTTILLPDGKPAGLPFRGIPSLDQSEILVVSGTEVQGVSTVDPVALVASAAWEFDPSRLAQVPVPGVVDPGNGNGDAPPTTNAILYDTFEQYGDKAHLLNVSAEDNPWAIAQEQNAVTPGEFIFLETAPPAGSVGGQAMRYFFEGTGPNCGDQLSDRSGGVWSPNYGAGNGWPEITLVMRCYFSPAFTLQHPDCSGFNEYKMTFLFEDPTRMDFLLQNGQIYGRWAGHPNPADIQPSGSDLSPGPEDYRGEWVEFVLHIRCPTSAEAANGTYRAWLNGQQLFGTDNIDSGSILEINRLRIGANWNRTLRDDQFLLYDYIVLYEGSPPASFNYYG